MIFILQLIGKKNICIIKESERGKGGVKALLMSEIATNILSSYIIQ